MAINFIPNDPLGGPNAPPLRQKSPRANRPASRAGFNLHDPQPQARFPQNTPGFLFWQCREAALAAMAAWERDAGALTQWALSRKRQDLFQNAVQQLGHEQDLNAFYDRSSFTFYEFNDGTKTTFSGASTDVVAHEVGHGLLDAIRPDLWDTPFLEVNAFHEAFGDCVALLTALADSRSRTNLLGVGVGARNFVEVTAEDLSDGIKRILPQHNAAAPRRALNTLQWQLPSTLPANGGPGVLINESHSFAQVFTGCFWDLIRNLLGGGASSAALNTAARKAAKLLIAGAKGAPETSRFFQAVGRAMILHDDAQNNGANRDAIRTAFSAHSILLGANAMIAPSQTLVGPPPSGRGKAALTAGARRDLLARLESKAGARMQIGQREIAGRRIVEAIHRREVPLGALTPLLRGVVAVASESVLVGGSGGRAAVLGGLPERRATTDEVMTYVESLLVHDRIRMDGKRPVSARSTRRSAAPSARRDITFHTHAIKTAGNKKVLTRERFACGCGGWRSEDA